LAVEVTPVANGRELKAFIAYPYELHRNDPVWIGPLRHDVDVVLSPKKNPFWDHAAAQHFLARANGKIVGRISAIDNKSHNEVHEEKVGFFGFFESIDDPAVAKALFDAAAAWLRARGLDTMRGPASPSMNDEAGLLVDGFQYRPAVMMPHNPQYYVPLVEGAGFTKVKDLLVFQGSGTQYPERLRRVVDLLEKRYGITVRTLDMKKFPDEVAVIKKIYNKAWEKNWGFVPMTERELEHLAQQFKPVIVPEMVVIAEHKGEPVGMGVCLPDFNVAFKKNPSGKMFPGILPVLWTIKFGDIGRARVLILGTIPEWRGKGVDALMYKTIWENGNKRGYTWCEGGWVLEDNAAMKNGLEGIGFSVYKTYRMYDRPL
jgi:GNAT superfamily N-acetyltransferase